MPDHPAFDPQALAALRAISPDDRSEFLRELITIFLNDTPQRIAELRVALAANDATTLARAAHSMKGSAGNFGAQRFAEINSDIEAQARDGSLGGIEAYLPQLDAEFERLKSALLAELGG